VAVLRVCYAQWQRSAQFAAFLEEPVTIPSASSNRPAWHTDDFPKLRSEPPWVTEEMVASQPDLVAPILANPRAAELAQVILDVDESGEPIVVTGCGTSEHGAMAVAELLDAALQQRGARGGRVEARQAFEAALDPRAGGLCLAVTESGGTRATLLALDAARETGAVTAAITANPAGQSATSVDVAMLTPARDLAWCHTVAYTSAILAGAALAAEIAEVDLDAETIADWLKLTVTPSEVERESARALQGMTVLHVVGSGADRGTARELALKIEEGARRPAMARDLETLLHGHFVACGPETGIIVVLTESREGKRRQTRAMHALEASARLGMPAAAILSPDAAHTVPEMLTPAGRIVLPAGDDPMAPLLALLGGAAALQRLTLAMVAKAGVNPDLIRREEAPYREAAALVEDRLDW
jgi:glucosamine--fructose-6-phosphate aminotransferase (isomerizing)